MSDELTRAIEEARQEQALAAQLRQLVQRHGRARFLRAVAAVLGLGAESRRPSTLSAKAQAAMKLTHQRRRQLQLALKANRPDETAVMAAFPPELLAHADNAGVAAPLQVRRLADLGEEQWAAVMAAAGQPRAKRR